MYRSFSHRGTKNIADVDSCECDYNIAEGENGDTDNSIMPEAVVEVILVMQMVMLIVIMTAVV